MHPHSNKSGKDIEELSKMKVNEMNPCRDFDELSSFLSSSASLNTLQGRLEINENWTVSSVVEWLQEEIRLSAPDGPYRKRCTRYLNFLARKYIVFPSSFFCEDVRRDGDHPLGGGGFADVYKGFLGSQAVCLKVLRVHTQTDEQKGKKMVENFCREALIWTQLSHPNVLQLLGVNTTLFKTDFCLVSSWMVNSDILTFLKRTPGHDRLRSIMTGKPPFPGLLDVTVLTEVVLNHARPERPTGVWCPDEIWEVVEKCWDQDRLKRPNATFVHTYLKGLMRTKSTHGASSPDTSPTKSLESSHLPAKKFENDSSSETRERDASSPSPINNAKDDDSDLEEFISTCISRWSGTNHTTATTGIKTDIAAAVDGFVGGGNGGAYSAPAERPPDPSPAPSLNADSLCLSPSLNTTLHQNRLAKSGSYKVDTDDPTYKVLPAALNKYKLNGEDWQNYAMFIRHGSPGKRVERCLTYDEKPLLSFQKLKNAKRNPAFILKHIKYIRSPIVVAQHRLTARKSGQTTSVDSNVPSHSASTIPSSPSSLMTPYSEDNNTPPFSASSFTKIVANSSIMASNRFRRPFSSNTPVPISYAIAIYPYMAEKTDEFDVFVGDKFIIISRERGWWVVEPDLEGAGVVGVDVSQQRWVPAGCFLELNQPVANAVRETMERKDKDGRTSDGEGEVSDAGQWVFGSNMPILTTYILTTGSPAIALVAYKKKREEELDLIEDDLVTVFKKHNHWSYAVKENSGDRGWVPSWFLGKVVKVNSEKQ